MDVSKVSPPISRPHSPGEKTTIDVKAMPLFRYKNFKALRIFNGHHPFYYSFLTFFNTPYSLIWFEASTERYLRS